MAKPDQPLHELSTAEEEILLVLMGIEKLYGLQIRDALIENQATIPAGSLYPLLYKLEDRKLIQSEWGEDQPGERGNSRRKYYTITQQGKLALDACEKKRRQLRSFVTATQIGFA